jgi:hypothetical protein
MFGKVEWKLLLIKDENTVCFSTTSTDVEHVTIAEAIEESVGITNGYNELRYLVN